jgi:hypothetical protein
MKRLFLIVFLILAIASITQAAATVTLSWDTMPAGQQWTEVRVYERIGSAVPYTYNLLNKVIGTPPANTIAITNVPVGTHTYVVRSYNGQSESVDSNSVPAIILSVPSAPTTITITITVQ